MSVEVRESCMIYPASETPRKILWMSRIDMIIGTPYSHLPVLFIYKHNTNSPNFFDTKILKDALSKALVPFYPIAGRLIFNHENGRYEIDCNAKGVTFVEVETTYCLDDLGDCMEHDSEVRNIIFPACDYTQELSSMPLLLVQLTRFKCGSVCIGLSQHHHIADGAGYLHFINSWARLANGRLDGLIQPIHDRAYYVGPREPPCVRFRHLMYEPPLPPLPPKGFSAIDERGTKEGTFKLSKEQMESLKKQAVSKEGETLTTFAVQAGHLWRAVCKARGLADDQDVKLYIPINGRSRLKDREHTQGYFGNLLFHATCLEKAGDITSKPLSYAATKIQKAIQRMDVEFLRSAIDFVESHPDLTAIVRGPYTFSSPNLFLNSWTRLPIHTVDFGWGTPYFMGINGIKGEGLGFIKPNSDGDGTFFIHIKLFAPHMELFRRYLYEF
ncbi:shikimate O-hydroxycinnamoyltransferase-like [Amaranthus tricolor]|uniref:shikimate O-hydroxycinnamoyltransferase-like n=1 Tax=Amaranthus tricolor TaxID=29722 RepID=UPI00258C3146|nr:shikimate O-hydroxycinnamoyltransferase-like [Amaranthus tricolor]